MTEPVEPVAIVEFDPTEGGKYCGAKTRGRAKYPHCHRPPGWGTKHPGHGSCKLHGGATPITTGRGSRNVPRARRVPRTTIADLKLPIYRDKLTDAALQKLYDQFADLDDPLNTLGELALMRALVLDWVNRYAPWRDAFLTWHASWTPAGQLSLYAAGKLPPAKPMEVMDVADGVRLLGDLSQAAEREWKRLEKTSVSKEDVGRLILEMALAVERQLRSVVPDAAMAAAALRRIREEWETLAVRVA